MEHISFTPYSSPGRAGTLIICALFMGGSSLVRAQVFNQTFSGSAQVADYQGDPPASHQFDHIGQSNANASTSIQSGSLVLSKLNGQTGTASFARVSAFRQGSGVLFVEFRIKAQGLQGAATNQFSLEFGQGLGTDNARPSPSSNAFARLALNYGSGSTQFSFRNIEDGQNSAEFNDWADVFWVMNPGTSGTQYKAPDNSIESLGAEKMDVWVGTQKIFDEGSIKNSLKPAAEFKGIFDGGQGEIWLDKIQVYEQNPMPLGAWDLQVDCAAQQVIPEYKGFQKDHELTLEASSDGQDWDRIASGSFSPGKALSWAAQISGPYYRLGIQSPTEAFFYTAPWHCFQKGSSCYRDTEGFLFLRYDDPKGDPALSVQVIRLSGRAQKSEWTRVASVSKSNSKAGNDLWRSKLSFSGHAPVWVRITGQGVPVPVIHSCPVRPGN